MKNFILIGSLIISGTVPDYGFKLKDSTLTPSSGFTVLVNGSLVSSTQNLNPNDKVVVIAP